jgi:predicted dehydrogenase
LQRLAGGVSLKTIKKRTWFLQPEKSGSAILDLHIHDVDFMRSILGEPKSVKIVSDMFEGGNQPTHVAAIYGYDSAYALVEGGWGFASAYGFRTCYRANFEDATIEYDSWNRPTVAIYDMAGHTAYPRIPSANRYDGVPGLEKIPGAGPYYEEIRYFLERVIGDKPIEQASLADAVKSYELTMTELELAYAQAGVRFPIND